jgi:hypothetical protein
MKLSALYEVTCMSIVAWWVIPVVVALLTGAATVLRDHRPHVRGSFEEIEDFRLFREALKRQNAEPSGSRQ